MNQNLKTALIVGGIAVALLIAMPLVWGGVWGWRGGGSSMMGGLGWGSMGILMIAFWGLIIWGIVALVRGLAWPGNPDAGRSDSALEVLKKRYARGEISKEEYEEKKRDLA